MIGILCFFYKNHLFSYNSPGTGTCPERSEPFRRPALTPHRRLLHTGGQALRMPSKDSTEHTALSQNISWLRHRLQREGRLTTTSRHDDYRQICWHQQNSTSLLCIASTGAVLARLGVDTPQQAEPIYATSGYRRNTITLKSACEPKPHVQSPKPFAPFVQRYNESALRRALCSSHSVGLEPRTLYNVERNTLRKFFYSRSQLFVFPGRNS